MASAEDITDMKQARMLLVRLIRSLAPNGAYSVTVNRQQGLALMCGFELESDASRMAAVVRAKHIGKYGGWKSQRGFLLSDRRCQTIVKTLAALPT